MFHFCAHACAQDQPLDGRLGILNKSTLKKLKIIRSLAHIHSALNLSSITR